MGDLAGKNRFFNEERETMSWASREEVLEKRFLRTFRHAMEHSRAYREIYTSAGIDVSDIRGLEDLEKLPLLRMDELVKRQKSDFPFGGFDTVDIGKIRRIYLNPGMIWQPGEWDYEDTTLAEAFCAAGIAAGDRVINTFSYSMWPFAFMVDESLKMLGATVIPTGAGNSLMQVKIMHMLGVDGFIGTPSFAMTLLQRAENMGLDLKKDLSLRTAVVGAEFLPESLRSRIEGKLDMMVRQVYGNVFMGCIGYECIHLSGLHIPDNILVEVVDPHTGKGRELGVAGEVVATNFNLTYPMIRMATGDMSMWAREACPCGRTGPMLERILGRIDQATTVKGTFVHPWQTDDIISRYPEVFKYQVVITRENNVDIMTFVLELNDESSRPEGLKRRIEHDIKDMLTIKGRVDIVPRGTIPDFHKKIEDRRDWA